MTRDSYIKKKNLSQYLKKKMAQTKAILYA